MSASNAQQASQLQNQQTILQQLNKQFEQQQLILQSEIKRQLFLIQQHEQATMPLTGQNIYYSNRSTDNTASSAVTAKRSVVGIDSDESRLSKKAKPLSISQQYLPLVKKLITHEHGWVFKDAVDPIELGIPHYFKIIKRPMDLTLVTKKLEDGAYTDITSFELDTKLVFENAILFNGEDSDVGLMAKELLNILSEDLNAMKRSM